MTPSSNIPVWLSIARLDIGEREIPGAPTTPKIAKWLQSLGAWWKDDETPWCGTACAAWMREAGYPIPKAWYRAKAWLDWGVPVAFPIVGAVAVFERKGGGHVGLIAKVDRDQQQLTILGGNQGDAVSLVTYPTSAALGFRWPRGAGLQRLDTRLD